MKVLSKVLIIEDESLLSSVYGTVLSLNNCMVETACDGVDGVKKLRTFCPNIILLDLLMPNMDGISFLKQFDWTTYPNTQIIVYSNLFDGNTVDQVKSLGAKDIVLKSSLSPNQLVALVSSHVS
jgi:DNA-binding NarL/FixJ family response regulator